MTNDGINSYAYDSEGRQVSVNSAGAYYDAFNRPVEIYQSAAPSGWMQVLYSPTGETFAHMRGQAVDKYFAPLTAGVQAVYTGISPAAVAYWRHADWLGSSRLATNFDHSVRYDRAYAPFGENYAETGTERSFTGQTQDTTQPLYDFLFRQQSSVQGRWLVPDPAGMAAVDMANPQTWNRYAYVMNNPLNAIDPLGLYCAVNADGTGTLNGCTQGAAGYGWGAGAFSWSASWTVDSGGVFQTLWPVFLGGLWDVFGGRGGGGSGSHPPSGGGTAGGENIANFPDGESLGIPNGLPTSSWGVWGAVLPPEADCGDFGPCLPSVDAWGGDPAAGIPGCLSVFSSAFLSAVVPSAGPGTDSVQIGHGSF